jgi:hypothetical protein
MLEKESIQIKWYVSIPMMTDIIFLFLDSTSSKENMNLSQSPQ